MILYVTNRQVLRDLPVSHLLPAGIFCYICPIETARFFCEKKDISGAVIDGVCDPDGACLLANDLHAMYPELPILFIAKPGTAPDVPAEVVRDTGNLQTLAQQLIDFAYDRVGWREGFSTFWLTLPNASTEAQLLGYPLHLSPRGAAILRCLFAYAPRVVPTDDLLQLCFPEGNQHFANLSVQISRINKSASKIGMRDLIVSEYGHGYRLNRGII